ILAAPAAQAECDLLARAVARSEGAGVVRAGAAAGQLSRAARRAMPAVPDSLPAFVYAHDRPVPPVVAHRLVEQVPAQRAVVTARLEQREDQAAERLLRRDDPRSGRNRKLHGLVTARGGAFVMLLELAFGDPRGIDGESLDARIAGRRHLAHLDAVRTEQVDDVWPVRGGAVRVRRALGRGGPERPDVGHALGAALVRAAQDDVPGIRMPLLDDAARDKVERLGCTLELRTQCER